MVRHTQKVKNATCDWFWADGSHMLDCTCLCEMKDQSVKLFFFEIIDNVALEADQTVIGWCDA